MRKVRNYWAGVVSRCGNLLAKASACRLQVSLSCSVLCQIVSLQYIYPDRLSTAWLVSLGVWSPRGHTLGPSVVLDAVDVPSSGPLHCSHIADYVYDFSPLSDPDIGPSVLVCDVEHTLSNVI